MIRFVQINCFPGLHEVGVKYQIDWNGILQIFINIPMIIVIPIMHDDHHQSCKNRKHYQGHSHAHVDHQNQCQNQYDDHIHITMIIIILW